VVEGAEVANLLHFGAVAAVSTLAAVAATVKAVINLLKPKPPDPESPHVVLGSDGRAVPLTEAQQDAVEKAVAQPRVPEG
jgi:hypothetical protein